MMPLKKAADVFELAPELLTSDAILQCEMRNICRQILDLVAYIPGDENLDLPPRLKNLCAAAHAYVYDPQGSYSRR